VTPMTTFTRHDDGRVTVNLWAFRILIAPEWLAQIERGESAPAVVREGDEIRFEVSNGRARYRIEGQTADGDTRAALMESDITCPTCGTSPAVDDACACARRTA
jgi:hypothetical protein